MGNRLAARESVADIVQSTCCAVLADLPSYEGYGLQRLWRILLLEARRTLATRGRYYARGCRDGARERRLEDCAVAADVMHLRTPLRNAAAREELARALRAIRALPVEQRRVVMLCRCFGMTPSEAARQLGKTANSVRVALHRASARLALHRPG